MKCQFCGSDISDDLNVCPNCHNNIKEDTKICPSCNTENISSAAFCKNCGHNFNEGQDKKEPEEPQLTDEVVSLGFEEGNEETPEVDKNEDVEEFPFENPFESQTPVMQPETPGGGGELTKHSNKILIIMAAVLIVALAGYFAYTYLFQKQSEDIYYSEVADEQEDQAVEDYVSDTSELKTLTNDDTSNNTSNTSSNNSISPSDNTTSEKETKNSGITPGIHNYKYLPGNISYDEAVRRAAAEGGYLVHIDSQEEFNKIASDLKNLHDSGSDVIEYYIGGRRNSGSYDYYWVDETGTTYGNPINSSLGSWFWYDDEPSFEDPNNPELVEDVLALIYIKRFDQWFGNDTLTNIVGALPEFSGKVGYIVEYE